MTVGDRDRVGLAVLQADNDPQVIAMWLRGRPATTQRACAYEVKALLAVVRKPLKSIILGDLQGYFGGLADLAPASQARAINPAKSRFSFGQRLGYLTFNPCAAVHSPKVKNTLAEIILLEDQVHRLLALEPHRRNRVGRRLSRTPVRWEQTV